MEKAVNKLFGYECKYEVNGRTNVVLFWVNGKKNIWLGVENFFDHFTTELNN